MSHAGRVQAGGARGAGARPRSFLPRTWPPLNPDQRGALPEEAHESPWGSLHTRLCVVTRGLLQNVLEAWPSRRATRRHPDRRAGRLPAREGAHVRDAAPLAQGGRRGRPPRAPAPRAASQPLCGPECDTLPCPGASARCCLCREGLARPCRPPHCAPPNSLYLDCAPASVNHVWNDVCICL